jgi:flagellar biogenesis protein FliO
MGAGAGAVIVLAGAPVRAQSLRLDPYERAEGAPSRTRPQRSATSENRDGVAAPTEIAPAENAPAANAPASSHKTWKELAQAHNEEIARGAKKLSGDEKSRESHAHNTSLSPMTAVSALAVVICLILILARVFRRHAPLFGQALPAEALEVLGRRFLDQRQSIVLLRIGSRILVVGSSAAGLQGIGEVTDPIEVDLIAGTCRGKNGQPLGSSFLGLLTGHTAPQPKQRPRNAPERREPERRAEPPLVESAYLETPSPPRSVDPARSLDSDEQLVRRLRAGSTPATAGRPEVFRD